jgi:glycosyltransferase involved in cell wall biosynthesis
MNNLISLAIISKNRPDVLKECIQDIQNKIDNDIDIIVVDSSEEHKDKINLKNFFKDKQNENKNRFFFEQVDLKMGSQALQRNICLKYCQTQYILFIDDDCFFRKNTFIKFLKFLELNIGRSALGVRINQSDSQDFANNILPKMSLIKWSSGSFNIESKKIVEVHHLQGTFMCFNTRKLKEIGCFNENLIYGYAPFEDTYTCLKMLKTFKEKPLLNYGIQVDHSLAPRLQGRSRDLGLDPINALAYGRNGMITSKMYFGLSRVLILFPLTLTYMIITILRPLLKSKRNIYLRLKSILYFFYGSLLGLINFK